MQSKIPLIFSTCRTKPKGCPKNANASRIGRKSNGCFQKIGVPQNGWLKMENPIKMDDLGGFPLFLVQHPNQEIISPSAQKKWRPRQVVFRIEKSSQKHGPLKGVGKCKKSLTQPTAKL